MRELPQGTVTLLFTDIEGSTRLLHELGPSGYADALAEHRQILREAAAVHDGVEVDTQGDAFFIVFPTAGGAAAAAQAAREGLAAGTIRVRMGLHTGAPTATEEGYVGEDVHRGARIAALAHGDQILVSPTTAALLDAEPLRDLGRHRLKDFEGGVRLYQLGEREFPPLRTPGSVELPTPATPFLGREQELFDAVSLVYERDPRVLTIVGPGGTGKTRFSIELARLLGDDAEGGTVFVPLAPLRDAEFVLPAVAERLGAASPEPAAIAARVGERRTHLVCDNLEHLLPGAARPLAELVAAVPALRLLATSREAAADPGRGRARPATPCARRGGRSLLRAGAGRATGRHPLRTPSCSSATGSTACRSRSSSRPPGRSCSPPRRSSNGSPTGSTPSKEPATPRNVT